ncbi:MAG: hypothetical protein IH881_12830 [Myxococcales bacterium]|nr:hypothetical protein [Myxococcales bacterium]
MKENTTHCDRSAHWRPRALALASLTALLLAMGAAPPPPAEAGSTARASVVAAAIDGRTLSQKIQAAYWRGRMCTTSACKAAQPSSFAHVASFGLAAFGGAWIYRRRAG